MSQGPAPWRPAARPLPALLMPVQAQASFAHHASEAEAPSPCAARRSAGGLEPRDVALEGPQLGSDSEAIDNSRLDRLAQVATSLVFSADPAQLPWGVVVEPPRAARAGLQALRPEAPDALAPLAERAPESRRRLAARLEDGGEPMQVSLCERGRLLLPYNRFLFASSGLAGLLGSFGLAAPWLTVASGAVLFTNVAFNVGFARETTYSQHLSAADTQALLAAERGRGRRLLRWLGVWPLSTGLSTPFAPLDAGASALVRVGDAFSVREQRSHGWNLSAVLPALVRVGRQHSDASANALTIARTGPATMAMSVRLGDRLRSRTWLRVGPAWASGHVGEGSRQSESAHAVVPWPSAEGLLTWQHFGDAYARAVAAERAWPLPRVADAGQRALAARPPWLRAPAPSGAPAAAAATRTSPTREEVRSHGSSMHFAWLPLPIASRVSQHGSLHVGEWSDAGTGERDLWLVRGLEETARGGYRFGWQCSLLWPAGDEASGMLRFAVSLEAATARNLPAFSARLSALLAAPEAPGEGAAPLARSPSNESLAESQASSGGSCASRRLISFPHEWTARIEGRPRAAPERRRARARPTAEQAQLFAEWVQPFDAARSNDPTRVARGDTPLARAFASALERPTAADRRALQRAFAEAGIGAFAEAGAALAPRLLLAHVHLTSETWLALELSAQQERMRLAADAEAQADAGLLRALGAHAAFWRQWAPLPAPLARAATRRGERLQALAQVLASPVAGEAEARRPRAAARATRTDRLVDGPRGRR